MSKPLSWHLDDYPKLKIEHPWLKNAIEKLEKEIERLGESGESLASLRNFMEQRRGRVPTLPVGSAITEIKRLEQEFGNLMARINRDGGHKAAEFKTTREAGEHCEKVFMDLVAKVELLEADAKVAVDGLLALTELFNAERSKVERLEEALATSDKACGAWELECDDREKAGRAEGMEAAAVIADSYNEPNIADAIRAAAKEQITPTHRDGGDAKETT